MVCPFIVALNIRDTDGWIMSKEQRIKRQRIGAQETRTQRTRKLTLTDESKMKGEKWGLGN